VKYKKFTGKVVVAVSTTPKVKKLCEHYGLEYQVTKIGFKWICGIMIKEDVLLGGEESGGIAIKGHIPERDGIWMGLTIWEFMAKSGKSLDDLIAEVYAIVGPFKYERNDLHISEALKQQVLKACDRSVQALWRPGSAPCGDHRRPQVPLRQRAMDDDPRERYGTGAALLRGIEIPWRMRARS
jgi:phosphomannomutase